MTGASPARVSPQEIAELLAWARALSNAGPTTDPAERAAYLAAKTDLLDRITHHHAAGREER
jgi:hypothetical protein